MSAITELCARLASLPIEPPQESVLEAARLRLFDTICCFAEGAVTDDAAAALRAVDLAGSFDVPGAMRYLSATIRSTEADDIHTPSCTTVGAAIIPVVLGQAALGGHPPAQDDRLLLQAIAAGYEAMTRLGMAIDGALRIYEGVWPTYVTAPFGAAASAATLLGLDLDLSAQALAIATVRSTGISVEAAGVGASSRWFNLGSAVCDGYTAALAAAAGMLGDTAVLERSFPRAVRVEFKPEGFWADADTWQILNMDTKPFRTNRQGLAAVDAFMDLLGVRSPDDCDSIQVFVPEQVLASVNRPGIPQDRWSPGAAYLLALAAYDRQALWDVHRTPVRETPAIRSFVDKVTVGADEALTGQYPAHWSARVRIRWSDGSEDEKLVLDATGAAVRPIDWATILEKHQRICRLSRPSRTDVELRDGNWLETAADLCRCLGTTTAPLLPGLLAVVPGLERLATATVA